MSKSSNLNSFKMEIMKKLWRSVVFKNGEIVRFTSMITSQSHAVSWRSAEEKRQLVRDEGQFHSLHSRKQELHLHIGSFALQIPWDNPEEDPVGYCLHSGV